MNCFTDNCYISFHGRVILILLLLTSILSLLKWKKTLRVIIIIEIGALIIIRRIFVVLGTITNLLVVLLVFIVGEALVLLSAFYHAMQRVRRATGVLLTN
jgi:hypothetical protein